MSSRRFAGLFVLMVFALFLARAGRAETANPFTVADVKVDVTAASASAAKKQALAEGQRRAFTRLLHRLTLPADYARLPQVDGVDYVQDYQIEREQASSVRYIATMSVQFDGNAVTALLTKADIPFTTAAAPPLVVLPVLTSAGMTVLWDDPNPWRDAWADLAPAAAGGVVPIDVPPGDLSDVRTVTAAQALADDTQALSAEGARFNSANVLVAAATLSADGTRLDVTLSGATGLTLPFTTISYTKKSGETAARMMSRAAADITRSIDTAFKQTAMGAATQPTTPLSAIVPLTGLSDWLAVRTRLARVATIRSYDVVSLSRSEAALILNVTGDQTKAKAALADAGLDLQWSGSYWTMSVAAGQ